MSTRTPMPSPRGTNREGLFLPARVSMALDAAPARGATLQDRLNGMNDAVQAVLAKLEGKLSNYDLLKVKKALEDIYVNSDDGEWDRLFGAGGEGGDPAEAPDLGINADGLPPRLRAMMGQARASMERRNRDLAHEMFPGLKQMRVLP